MQVTPDREQRGDATLSPVETQQALVAAAQRAQRALDACPRDGAGNARLRRTLERDLSRTQAAVLRSHESLVMLHARKIARLARSHDVADLAQWGRIGLLKALEKFEPERGFTFGNYAEYWVVSFVRRALSHDDAVVRVPANVLDNHRTLHRHASAFEAKEGRAPDPDELAAAVRLLGGRKATKRRIEKVLEVDLSEPTSMDKERGLDGYREGANRTMHDWVPAGGGDFTPAHCMSPEEIVLRREREALALGLVAELEERERRVVIGRYWEEKTCREVGASSGVGKKKAGKGKEGVGGKVTRQRVQQIEREAMGRLRGMVEGRGDSTGGL